MDHSTVGDMRSMALFSEFIEKVNLQRTEKDKGTVRKQYGWKEINNSLFKLSVDLFRYGTHVKVLC